MGKKLLLLLLLILSYDAYSDSGGSMVKSLPGFQGPLPFELETGYIGIGEEEELQLFYYFIKSERNPKEDPLLLWISGGPGCSSFTGFLFENGPVTLKSEGYNGGNPTLVSTTHSWTKVASILYLDQPVGVGFSYSTIQRLNDTFSDTGEAKRIHEFIRKWLDKHEEFISNPFYVGGDSYSGKVIPPAVQEISKGNDLGFKPLINLQGYVLGNPITDIEAEFNARIPYSHGMSLISDELYESLKKICKGNYNYENVDPRNTECLELIDKFRKSTYGIFDEHILRPICDVRLATLLSPKDLPRRSLRELICADVSVSSPHSPDCVFCIDLLSGIWANEESVRKALRVEKGSIGQWERCIWDLPYQVDIKSSVPYHKYNSIKGYRSLIYSEDHDLTVPFMSTQAWIKSLNYTIIDDWRSWMINNQVVGYTRTYANKMTFATVKGGGHTAEYKPEETFTMFKRWIDGQPL